MTLDKIALLVGFALGYGSAQAPVATLTAANKCLARNNKSPAAANATKKR